MTEAAGAKLARNTSPLDWLNFLLADVQDGLGPFLAVYLLSSQHWEPGRIGVVGPASSPAPWTRLRRRLYARPAIEGWRSMDKGAIKQALTAAMMQSSAPMVLSDPHLPDLPMVVVNQAFADLTGYPVDALVNRNCRFLQGPKTDIDAAPRIRACLEAGQGCIEWIVNYRRDGSVFWNLLFISPIRDADGTLLYFFGNQLDITKGFPDWLIDVSFGRAHLVPELEQEFHALLREIGEHNAASNAQALERIVRAAHRLAEISTQLAPGTLDEY